jgi:uroporphyrinogen decarboxylase
MAEKITSRERVITTLQHKEPDRIPVDLGSFIVTSMVKEAMDRFREYIGLGGPPHEVMHTQLGLSMPKEDMMQYLGVDTRRIALNPPRNFKEIELPDGSRQDEWGVVRRPAGPYFDTVHWPLGSASTLDDLKKYHWPDPDDPGRFAGLKEKAAKLYNETDYAIVADIALDGLLDSSREIIGLEKFMIDLYESPGFIESWLDMMTEYSIRLLSNYMDAVGDYIQVVCVTDDLGFQDRPQLSPAMYRKFLKPRHKKIYDAIKAKTNAKVLHHCCGSVYKIIPDLIEEGVDILNPIQTYATDMSAEKLVEFKNELSFWGGIDEQFILPNGTPRQVDEEVKRIIGILGPGGGFIPFATHNIQADTPSENIKAMFDAIKKYGVYPIVR